MPFTTSEDEVVLMTQIMLVDEPGTSPVEDHELQQIFFTESNYPSNEANDAPAEFSEELWGQIFYNSTESAEGDLEDATDHVFTTSDEVNDASAEFKEELWGQIFYNSTWTDEINLEDTTDCVFRTATTHMMPRHAKANAAQPTMTDETIETPGMSNSNNPGSETIKPMPTLAGRGTVLEWLVFVPTQCNTCSYKLTGLFLLLKPLVLASHFDNQTHDKTEWHAINKARKDGEFEHQWAG